MTKLTFINPAQIKQLYATMEQRIAAARQELGRPLTLTEKILYSHLQANDDTSVSAIERGGTTIRLVPDRVCMQDATAQMAILQFMTTQMPRVATPTSVHCDHLIKARRAADQDLTAAKAENKEVYDFLKSTAKKYGMDYWQPGAGIIHQIFLENYAFPGGLVIGTDSHTPTSGGLGMIAIGVGGADAVDVMVGQPWQTKCPKIIGVHLTGQLNGWSAPKDVILDLCDRLTAKGGTGYVIEYFGPGVNSISCTGKSTIANMGAEMGATTSVFPYDARMADFLNATHRGAVADLADQHMELLQADPEISTDPERYFNQVVEINLSELEPAVNGPDTPDARRPLSTLAHNYGELDLPETIAVCLIGSCTNSSYEDMSRAVAIAEDAHAKGLRLKTKLMVTPGSNQIAATMQRDGFMDVFKKIGATVLSNACGPCIGQWDRDDIAAGEKNVIVTSFNRNFKKRNDGRTETYAFVTSPELVVAMAFAGNITFNPLTDTLTAPDGTTVTLAVPNQVADVPQAGYAETDLGYQPPATDGSQVKIVVNPDSERLQLLEPFSVWDVVSDFSDLAVIMKAKGKCTTDHISPAGPWLRFRGHLDNISDNLFTGVENAFAEETGYGYNVRTGATEELHKIARDYKAHGIGWLAIGDENFGEGSSREHAAMEPRFLGCRAIVAKSFARIAEANLKKQGILPLWFQNQDDYDTIQSDDRVTIVVLDQLQPDQPVELRIQHADGTSNTIQTTHTLTDEEIRWLRAGSALNVIAANQ